AFTYDPMNRLTSAKYREKTSSSWNVNSGRYDVTNLVYDRNGNIKSLQRKGMTNPAADPPAYGVIDNLSYTYENSGKSNRLQRINDAGVKTVMTGVEHFVDGNTSNTDYLYDNSGNLKQDLNKGISSIAYNHLNKPTLVTFSNGKKIQYIYDAAGSKLRQKVFGNGGSATTVETDYLGPFHYEDSDGDGSSATTTIQFFAHEEGRVRRAGSDLIYETFLKDHLGNVRVMFADMNGDGWGDPNPVNGEVLQVDHYYPFGLRMAGLSLVPAVKNSYLFTGKEAQDELGLGWIDFGARMYDAAAGRWNAVDALGEINAPTSLYVYVNNSPIARIDPDGNLDFSWDESIDNHRFLINEKNQSNGDGNGFWHPSGRWIPSGSKFSRHFPNFLAGGVTDPPNSPDNPKDGEKFEYNGRTYFAMGGHWNSINPVTITSKRKFSFSRWSKAKAGQANTVAVQIGEMQYALFLVLEVLLPPTLTI
ncbi:MAG: RHS repeat-associated core domain-containing protein, partial [Bacteroidia bacterium]|nr:RHS repeat-associated core domain-containing protein [Bacteroidia bacterium]